MQPRREETMSTLDKVGLVLIAVALILGIAVGTQFYKLLVESLPDYITIGTGAK